MKKKIRLIFNFSRITNDAIETIAAGISENHTIETLNVSKNLFDQDFFGEALRK